MEGVKKYTFPAIKKKKNPCDFSSYNNSAVNMAMFQLCMEMLLTRE